MTDVWIDFGLVDVSAKSDAAIECNDKQNFVDMSDLTLEGVYAPKYETLEPNYWKLDGTFELFPTNPSTAPFGLWSKQMSGEDGSFSTPIILTITFASKHNFIGTGFEFNPHENSYCNNLNIKYYEDETIIQDLNLTPDNWSFSFRMDIDNVNKMVITFNSLNKANRYLKLQSLIYGVMERFQDDDLISCTILEEINILSTELPTNTMEFTAYSKTDDFNIFNPKGIYNAFEKKQFINVGGVINGTSQGFGTFYLNEWTSSENKMMTLSTVNAIGIMENTYFKGGLYNNVTAKSIIDEIMTDAGFAYYLDDSLAYISVSGWLPRCSHREAIQQVCVAIGAYIDTTRSGAIRIKPYTIDETDIVRMGKDRKHIGTKVSLNSLVTGVNVTEHEFVLNTDIENLFEGELEAGKNEVTFNEPCVITNIENAQIIDSNVNGCTINVTSTGTVTITGNKYTDNTKTVSVKMQNLPKGEKENILELNDAKLVNTTNGKEIANRIFNYYQKRIQQEIYVILDNETVGRIAEVEVYDDTYRNSMIKSLDIDLVGGFVTKAVVIGE